jgi:hypothetical protein
VLPTSPHLERTRADPRPDFLEHGVDRIMGAASRDGCRSPPLGRGRRRADLDIGSPGARNDPRVERFAEFR